MNFIAFDVETANYDFASICQIGLVEYENGVFKSEWKSYVDPEDEFDEFNISIHGISEKTVLGAPKFPELFDKLNNYFTNKTIVTHTHFDRVAILQVAEKYNISIPNYIWLDSARVARRTWKECAWNNYGLHDVCEIIGYKFKHHDALEDAKASAQILLSASKIFNYNINDWINRVKKPIDLEKTNHHSTKVVIQRDGDPEGPLFGEVLVFTGSLSLPRRTAADMAAKVGCQVAPSVTTSTSILVVGNQDIKKLSGKDKSSKHLKAEELIKKGVRIQIIKEDDFIKMVNIEN